VGQGVTVNSIAQARDEFLDVRYRNANSSFSTYESSLSALKSIEGVVDETETDGLAAVLADFYSSLEDLSNNSEDVTYASLVRSAAEKVINVLNEYASQFSQIEEELNYDLELAVNDANTLVSKINELNTT
jgi:flagellar hook-associated protein 1 FlgK